MIQKAFFFDYTTLHLVISTINEIVEGREVLSFVVFPCKRLVAIVPENSEDQFEIIQVKLPGDKERRTSKGQLKQVYLKTEEE